MPVEQLPAPRSDEVFEAICEIARADEIGAVWSCLTGALARMGFERVNYGFTRYRVGHGIGDPLDAFFLSTHALERVKEFHTSGLYLRTPEFHWVRENVGACSWGYLRAERAAGRLSKDECRAQDEIGARRQRAGYTISFAESQPRSKGAMGMGAAQGVRQEAVDAWWETHADMVMALCNCGHLRLSQMPLPVERIALTDRQRGILELLADGKMSQDIGLVLGLSQSTIEKHLRNARDSLGVETTAQAVAKLAFLGQLFVQAPAHGAPKEAAE